MFQQLTEMFVSVEEGKQENNKKIVSVLSKAYRSKALTTMHDLWKHTETCDGYVVTLTILSTYIQVSALAAFLCSPFLILFLLIFLPCNDLSCSLISTRIKSKNLTPETQLSHWAKCAAHKLRYPSKAFHTPNLQTSSPPILSLGSLSINRMFYSRAQPVLVFLLFFSPSTIILEVRWNECFQLSGWNEKDYRMNENNSQIFYH